MGDFARVLLIVTTSVALVGCEVSNLSPSQTDAGLEDATSASDTDDGDAGQQRDVTQSQPDTSTPSDTDSSDTSPSPDTSQPDTSQPDTSEPADVGPPDYENTCDSGPLDAPIEGCRPDPLPSTGDPYEDCVRRINQLRWECQCLPPLQRWHEGESCADDQAAYDAQNGTPHGGFSAGICSPRGRAQNECPGWGSWSRANSGCLQMMWDEGPGEPFSEHGHYINMTNPAHSKVACGGADGWFVQNFQ